MSSDGKSSVAGGATGVADKGPRSSFTTRADVVLNAPGKTVADSASNLVQCKVNLTGESHDSYGVGGIVDGAGLLDFGSGKDGVMSRRDADALERRVMSKIEFGDGMNLTTTEDVSLKRSFLMAFRLYLAMHSSENADDGSGGLDDGVTFSFGASTLSGASVKAAAQLSSFHRYLRGRADEVRDAIKFVLARAALPSAERDFPLACETARSIRVLAATRHVPDYPQYAFVGAEYCSTVTPRVRDMLTASKAALLAVQRGSDARHARPMTQSSRMDAASSALPDF